MRGLAAAVIAAVELFGVGLGAAVTPVDLSQPLVNVRLTSTSSPIEISGFGLMVDDGNGARSLDLLPVKRVLHFHHSSAKRTIVTGEMLRLNGDEVPNKLVVFVNKGRRIEVVTQLPLDEYLKGVIPSEMPSRWPLEALKAQAVASRSYALRVMQERASEHYHLDASTNHQVFKLINYLGARGTARDNIVRALEETRGLVLTDIKSQGGVGPPIYKAYFHADCGGATEEPRAVWGGGPRMGTVRDSGCAISGHGAWSARLSLRELEQGAQRFFGEPLNGLHDLIVLEPSASGRVGRVGFVFGKDGNNENVRWISSQEFRQLFGFNVIKSTRFSLERDGGSIVFNGRGHGHGVGMCQYGARFMAMGGATHEEILKRYYSKARLQAVNSGKALASR